MLHARIFSYWHESDRRCEIKPTMDTQPLVCEEYKRCSLNKTYTLKSSLRNIGSLNKTCTLTVQKCKRVYKPELRGNHRDEWIV